MSTNYTHDRCWIGVDLDAIERNMDLIHGNLTPGTLVTAVIKADGYGHGAAMIGRSLQKKPYIWGFAVATPDEAEGLREAGVTKPVLMLGYVFPWHYKDLIRKGIRICVFTEETAREVSQAAQKAGKDALVHIAIDTGMSRIGFSIDDGRAGEAADAIERIAAMPGIVCEGLFTHFARADEVDDEPAMRQLRPFLEFKESLEARGVTFPLVHAANSAAALKLPASHLDMVRVGVALYGLSPSSEVPKETLGLTQAISIHSRITYVKTIPEGVPVSYGGTYVTDRRIRIATIPVGYADGYPRALSNKASVLIHGQRARILGRVCMDQFMVDVSDIPDVKAGDEVVLLGRQGSEMITAEEIGDMADRFNYELVCDINKRVPRLYTRNGEIVAQVDYFKM